MSDIEVATTDDSKEMIKNYFDKLTAIENEFNKMEIRQIAIVEEIDELRKEAEIIEKNRMALTFKLDSLRIEISQNKKYITV